MKNKYEIPNGAGPDDSAIVYGCAVLGVASIAVIISLLIKYAHTILTTAL